MKKFLPEISLLLLIAFLNLEIACSRYYRVTHVAPETASTAMQFPGYKYIILHQGTDAWHLTRLAVDDAKQMLNGRIEEVTPDHFNFTRTKPRGSTPYRLKNGDPTVEVHLYTSEYVNSGNNTVSVPLAAINKIDVYEPDKGATAASYILGGLGIAAGVYLLIGIIVLLTKSSCPLVYINNGADYRFVGEMYGGAVNSNMERDDFMPLPGLRETNGNYTVRISNELLEKQYTNVAELLVAEYPSGTTVIADRQGVVHQMNKLQAPEQATAGDGQVCTNSLAANDSLQYLFNIANQQSQEFSSLEIQFKKPANASTANLVMRLKNSYWLDYIYGKFNEQFGSFFNEFNKRQQKVPAEVNQQWSLDQGIPLSVYVQTSNGWRFVDYVNTVGPLAARDVVVPVDVAGIEGQTLNLKLECGYAFWEIDCAAIDYTASQPVAVKFIQATSVTTERGRDVSAALAKSDKKYLYQPDVGNVATLTFKASKPAQGIEQSVFFHTRGYYEYIRHYKGVPDLAYLRTFRQKGAFARFSKERYDLFVNDKDFIINALTSNDAK